MRWHGLLAALAVAVLTGGCGGDDGNDVDAEDRSAEVQQVVNDTLAAYVDKDFEAMCELQDQVVNESIAEAGKADTCAEGYENIFKEQADFTAQGQGQPFDDFIKQLDGYEAGAVTFPESGPRDAEVALEGPKEATTLLVEEEGEFKVSELFVTANPNAPNQ
jgi:hypothetical protein